jgi:ribosomal protein L37AE/L43A
MTRRTHETPLYLRADAALIRPDARRRHPQYDARKHECRRCSAVAVLRLGPRLLVCASCGLSQ